MATTKQQLESLYQQIMGSAMPATSSANSTPSPNASNVANTTNSAMISTMPSMIGPSLMNNQLNKADLKSATSYLSQSIQGQLDTQTSALTSNISNIFNTTNPVSQQSIADVNQRVDGQQARLDAFNADKTQAQRMASADHSLLEQLKQHFARTVMIVNQNTETEAKLIKQLQQPIQINGKELLAAIEAENNTTIQRQISQQVVAYVNASVQSIEDDRKQIEAVQQRATQRINQLMIWLAMMLVPTMVAMAVPSWPIKVLLVVLAMIGGGIYGFIKLRMD